MAGFLREADILVSPRIKGSNTPMKIYSYLDSGKPVIATNLFTHTQVLTPDVAKLPAPEPAAFAAAMRELAEDPGLRQRLGQKGHELVLARYSTEAFRQSMDRLYKAVETEVAHRHDKRDHAAQTVSDET
jgi:glycosyltransferase involved in cell wall biosynthesis